jgi:hypothetical protein
MEKFREKRYQELNIFGKIWRSRWLLTIPFVTVYYFLNREKVYKDEIVDGKLVQTDEYEIMTFRMCWGVACGNIDMKMKHYYTSEEMKEFFKKYE